MVTISQWLQNAPSVRVYLVQMQILAKPVALVVIVYKCLQLLELS